MSADVTQAMIDAFSANVIHLAQERGSKLQGAVTYDTKTGERVSKDRIGTVELVQRTTRHGDNQHTEIPNSRRWATPVPYEGTDYLDEEDDVRIIAELDNEYAQSFGFACGRRQDITILRAALGTATTGRDASGSQALTAGQKIAVNNHSSDPHDESLSGDVGLTVGKLIEAKKILLDAGVDPDNPMDELHIAVDGTQLNNLLRHTKVSSVDFNQVKALIDGSMTRFMGFNFHVFGSSILDTDASSDSLVVAWSKSGLWLDEPIPKRIRVEKIPTKGYAWQIHAKIMLGAVRLDESRVVQIACDPN